MCGRYYLTATPEQVIDAFELIRLPRYQACYNIPPGQKILTVVQLDDGRYKAVNLHWGLIPHWAKDIKISQNLINARAETLAEKPAFKSAYYQRRCLIPATGFYEWQNTKEGKQAYCIKHKDDQLLAFAGHWESWKDDAETIYSCTIITTAANEIINPIHHRMPVIISKQNQKLWLDKKTAFDTTRELLGIDSYQGVITKPISGYVNNPSHNNENCLKS